MEIEVGTVELSVPGSLDYSVGHLKGGVDLADSKPMLVPLPNGPYYLIPDQTLHEIPYLQSSRGEPRANVRGVALCRCGGSQNKPFCDGTHGTNDFSDAKLTDGSIDKRDDYVGKKITIHDNRGICAHSAHCTDNLASVFKLETEPWIDPNGADIDEIIATIEKCPSGALSYSIDGVEYRDQDREPMVTITKDGPYAVTGRIELEGPEQGEGASKEHYTLCRCGQSKNKPFCDGSHWYAKFRDDKN